MEVLSKGMELWFLFLLAVSVSTVPVDGQVDSTGFINIDCGRAANTTYYDRDLNLTYLSDDQFIDRGVNYPIDSRYVIENIYEYFRTVRSFPSGTRNCYTLRSLKVGTNYLVRATFLYANYDELNKIPTFDLHLGVNYWDTVKFNAVDEAFYSEVIVTALSDNLQVCLINKNLGTPFISELLLRTLSMGMYKIANSTQSLVTYERLNIGASSDQSDRLPDDLYDRIWMPYMEKAWTNISTSSKVDQDIDFATPSSVLQTAAITSSTKQTLDHSWTWHDKTTVFMTVLHISEIQNLLSSSHREFDILADGSVAFNESFVPQTLRPGWAYFFHSGQNQYNFSLKATLNSTLPPLLNAYELYIITPATGIRTYSGDAVAMDAIKANYKVSKDWSGDPCAPTEFKWSGVTCSSDSSNTLRITALDLSSSGLTGAIVSSFGDLSALKSLDLSNNDLSGDLPAFLDKLTALTYLDITGNNKISASLPPGLQSKKNDGHLIFKSGSKKKKSSVAIIAAIAVVIVVLLIAAAIIIVVCLRRRKNDQSKNQKQYTEHATTHQPHNYVPQPYNQPENIAYREENITPANIPGQNYPNVQNEPGNRIGNQNRQFSYNDLVNITNKFQNNIGTGGFGSVYVGNMENGTKVAVKMRSDSSSQGVKEFLAEAQNLTRVHHKHLVSLIGYCMDENCMALVYEYMPEGTLQNKLTDNTRPLSWKQRVRIAYESALGLEYLHKSCNPPLIHRDVKTSNILLNENLEARIADFGLSRAFNNDSNAPVSTMVVGTPGYLDPEYYSTYQLSEKSDVFSFGVVLLELITGRSPIISGPEGGHLKQWVNQKLARGDIESIVDPRMNGYYDINSVWKVTELARKCTENSSAPRPTMSTVAAELQESLDLEISTEGTRGRNTTYNMPHNYSRNENFVSDVSQNSAFEMGYMGGSMAEPGPIAR